MEASSRRQFIRSLIHLATTGFSPALLPFLAGWSRKETSSLRIELKDTRTSTKSSIEQTAKIDPNFKAAYLGPHRTGELKKRGDELWKIMESCRLCPRECGASRLKGEEGFCGASSQLEISAYHPHFGEEISLVGSGGSGTIFLTNCGLRCVFCINWEISQGGEGNARSIESMADMMIYLQKIGCHNINLVTPTHYSPHIILAVDLAASKGLRLPIVYNTCGWERMEILRKLDGVVDIYLPDFKYADGKKAEEYSSGAESYPKITKEAILEMNRQVGVAKPAADGLLYRGLIIRHLVMPNQVAGTEKIMKWIGENLPKDTYLNIMAQYRPVYKAYNHPEIARRITREEYKQAVRWAKEAGLTNLDIQGNRF